MKQYLELMRDVLTNGTVKEDRTGTGTRSVFGRQMRFDLQQGFPLVTTKKLHLKSIVHELIWFLSGSTNVQYLRDNGVSIWDEWADENGELGPIYGYQWRSWPGSIVALQDIGTSYEVRDGEGWQTVQKGTIVEHEALDQISQVIEQLKTNPDSRRLIVSAWNVADVPKMKLPPCHTLFQFYTRELTLEQRYSYAMEHFADYNRKGYTVNDSDTVGWLDDLGTPIRALDCQLYMRSVDIFLGAPFNIASYALLTHMIAQQVNMVAGDFVWSTGDTHIYSNHVKQCELQLSRDPKPLPKLEIRRKPESIFDYKYEDFFFYDYYPHPAIKALVAV